MSYPGHSFGRGGSYHSAEMQSVNSTATQPAGLMSTCTINLELYIYIYIYITLPYNIVLLKVNRESYMLLFRPLDLLVECSPMVQETGVQSQVESYQRLKKWYLMLPCLTLSIIGYWSRVKWNNPGNRVVPSPTPWCSRYWKCSLRVTLD